MDDILESTTVLEQTPGQILKAAREAKQIGIGEVTQRLLLSKSIVAAIEEDDYSRIPAPVYAEGYLKAYAQFLQIPVDTVLVGFRRLNVYSKSEAVIETKAQVQDQACRCRCRELSNLLKGKCRGYVILGAVVVLVLIVSAVFISKQFSGRSAEVIHVPKSDGGDNVVSDDQIPINVTTAAEVTTVPNISPNGKEGNDSVISDNQMPIITTTAPEAEMAPKKKHSSKKINKSEAQDVPLMLDANSTAGKSGDNKEPNLILTKPQSLSGQIR
ncbi:MAG: helix-turn-helix domain-containing protein [bacterium]